MPERKDLVGFGKGERASNGILTEAVPVTRERVFRIPRSRIWQRYSPELNPASRRRSPTLYQKIGYNESNELPAVVLEFDAGTSEVVSGVF